MLFLEIVWNSFIIIHTRADYDLQTMIAALLQLQHFAQAAPLGAYNDHMAHA